jgi:hypothetical protein
MSATNRGTKRLAQDSYPTPHWCVNAIASRVAKLGLEKSPGLLIIDAGAGDGRIGREVARCVKTYGRVYLIDTDPAHAGGWDKGEHDKLYLCQDYPEWLAGLGNSGHYSTLFVSNPPFSQAEDFVYGTVDWMSKNAPPGRGFAIFLLRLNWLGSQKRAAWLNEHPPCRITVLAPRPSFVKTVKIGEDGKKKQSSNDSCEYAWIWWGASNQPLVPHFEVAVKGE